MQSRPLKFLSDGGECGAYIRSFDWNNHPLGSPDNWPQSLLCTLSIVLRSRFPMFLYWGPKYYCFYNDAFLPSLGEDNKHPATIGSTGIEVWGNSWEAILPNVERVMQTGESSWYENRPVNFFRNGRYEDMFWTYSSSAVTNDEGDVYGVLVVCTETTATVKDNKKLTETNEWLQVALEAGEMGTWDLNPLTKKFHSSEFTKKLFNLPEETEEVDLGQAIESIHKRDRTKVKNAIELALVAGSRFDMDYTVVQSDASERIINAKGKLYYSEEGIANRFAGIVHDVTNEVNARRQLLRLVSLVENSYDYISIAGLHGNVMYLNPAGRRMVGLSEMEDVTHLHVKDFHLPEHYEETVRHLRDTLANEGKWSGKIMLQHFVTDEVIPCQAEAINISDPETGELIARGITLRDLRPELEARKALQESQERLSLALKATNMGTYDWDIVNDQLTWDERCKELFGIPPKEQVAYVSTFLNGLHPNDRSATEAAVARSLNPDGDGSYTAIYRTISANGKTLFWVQATGRCFFNDQRKPIRLIGTVIDITDQIAAQEEIKERESHFRLLTDAINQLVWIADVSGKIIYLNKSSYQFTDKANQIKTIQDWAYLLHPSEQENYFSKVLTAFTKGEEMIQEHRLCHHNKQYFWHLTRITPYKDVYGNIEFWVSSSTNIQLIKDQAEQKNDFFQMASHELKTPVTSLKAFAQYLHKMFEKNEDTTAATLLGKMSTQITKLEILIKDLLDINKIEGGKMRFNEVIFDFTDLVWEIVEEIQRTTSKQIFLVDKLPALVFGDKDRIGQVITNLISNAIKYSPEADRIEIMLSINNGNITCSVKDYGIGIPLEQQKHVFDRFYRVSGLNTDTFPGLGLGLYISAEIIKRQNGNIWVKSEPRQGSEFGFSLPLHNA